MMMPLKPFLRVFLFVAVLMPAHVFAVDKLTEDIVKEYYKKSYDISQNGSNEELLAYIDKHTDPEAVITYKYPSSNQDPDADGFKTDTHTKASLISLIKKARKNSKSALQELEYELTEIKISEDGQSAQVTTMSDSMYDSGQMRFLETSESVDVIKLNDEGVIVCTQINHIVKNVRYIPN